MQITILAFGQVASITGNRLILDEAIIDTNSLKLLLEKRFIGLKTIKYSIAVDRKTISENTVLHNNSVVALLPPFSGG